MSQKSTAQKIKHRVFNLLSPYQSPPTTWDKIYDWLLGRARIVMLIAEFAVVISFVLKVAVDTEAKNLNEEIETNNFELQQYAATIEPQIRLIQLRAQGYKNLWENSSAYSAILNEIYSYFPNLSANIVVRITGSEVTITGDGNLIDFSRVETQMKNSDTFSEVVVQNINSEGGEVVSGQGSYALVAKIKEIQNRSKLTTL